MALVAGRRLGPYQIESVIGSGGMGEVYRARDTRLGRSVAIKILPSHLSAENERKRFEREARVISNLTHPHICALHDVGHDEGVDYLVMELLEGETLEARLRRGPLPLEPALRAAIEIAGALHHAHRQGIVHRDLKPGNIMLTRNGVKLLDFGLAKFIDSTRGPVSTSAFTASAPLTSDQMIVGTLPYMAPEQLEGREVDMRADVFALGAVLYEMVTGRRAFGGESRAGTIAAVLSTDPPSASTLEPSTPPALDRVIRTCLAKQADERWQNAHDLALALEWIVEVTPARATALRRGRERWVWGAAAGGLVLAVAALWFSTARQRAPEPRLIQLSVMPPQEDAQIHDADISPDGRWLAYTALIPRGVKSVWVRRLDSTEAHRLPGSDNAVSPFWSPDSRFVAFFGAGGKLWKIEVPDGTVQPVCDAPQGERGTWSADGTILFGDLSQGIYQVPASGGTPTAVIHRSPSESPGADLNPCFLPDNRHFLFVRLAQSDSISGIYVGSLDSEATTRLLPDPSSAVYASPGYLLFVHEGNLIAQAFDAARLRLTGPPISIAESIADRDFARFVFSASANGLLAYREADRNSRLTWFDRAGRTLQKVGEPANYVHVDLSPDDSRAAVERIDPDTGDHDVWIVDLVHETTSRLTFDSDSETYPIWSPDGTRVAFGVDKGGQYGVVAKPVSGVGKEETLVAFDAIHKYPTCWSAQGYLVFEGLEQAGEPDIWVQRLDGSAKAVPYERRQGWENFGQLSPDGRWLVFSAGGNLFVQSFPTPGGKWQIDAGSMPRWRRDGKELFYGTWAGVNSVDVSGDDAFHAGAPRLLFGVSEPKVYRNRYTYAVSRDGQRFLANVAETGFSTVSVVVNWTGLLK
jgi:eukaryotic-like serine/threonine-protein kinase